MQAAFGCCILLLVGAQDSIGLLQGSCLYVVVVVVVCGAFAFTNAYIHVAYCVPGILMESFGTAFVSSYVQSMKNQIESKNVAI